MSSNSLSNFGALAVAPALLLFCEPRAQAQTNSQYTVPSNAALSTFPSPTLTGLVITREGYATPGDGGYAQYFVSTMSAVDNTGTCTVADSGYQVSSLIVSGSMTMSACYQAIVPPAGLPIAVWGALPSSGAGTTIPDISGPLNAAFTSAALNNIPLWCGPGTYGLLNAVQIPSGISLSAGLGTCEITSLGGNVGVVKTISGTTTYTNHAALFYTPLSYTSSGGTTSNAGSHIHISGVIFDGGLSSISLANAPNQLNTNLIDVIGGDDIVFSSDRWQNAAATGIMFDGTYSPLMRSGVRDSVFHNVGTYWHAPESMSSHLRSNQANSSSLTFNVTGFNPFSNLAIGMAVTDPTTPGSISTGTTVSSLMTTTVSGTITLTTVGVSSTGSALSNDNIVFGPPFFITTLGTLTATSVAFSTFPVGVFVGMNVFDETNPPALPIGTSVTSTSVSGGTLTVSLSGTGNVQANDILDFGPPYKLVETGVTSGTIITISSPTTELLAGMTVFDQTTTTAVPSGTTVSSVGSGTVTVSKTIVSSSGDTLVFGSPYGDASPAVVSANGTTINNRGNFFIGNRFDQIGADAIDVSNQSNILINKNVCDLSQAGWQTEASPLSSAPYYGVSCLGIGTLTNGLTVASNVIDGATGDCMDVGPTSGTIASNLTVVGNVVRHCGGAGIAIGNVSGFYVGANVILDSHQGTLFSNPNLGAISFVAGGTLTQNGIIAPNTISDDQSPATTDWCIWSTLSVMGFSGVSFSPSISCTGSSTTGSFYGGSFRVAQSSGGFGSGQTLSALSNPFKFQLVTGTVTGGAASGTITLPPAPAGWNCNATDLTTQSATTLVTKQIAPTSRTTAVIESYSAAGTASSWSSGDTLAVTCSAY